MACYVWTGEETDFFFRVIKEGKYKPLLTKTVLVKSHQITVYVCRTIQWKPCNLHIASELVNTFTLQKKLKETQRLTDGEAQRLS